jgi:TPR repeat protein
MRRAPHYQRSLPFALDGDRASDRLGEALLALDAAGTAAELQRALDELRDLARDGSAGAVLTLGRVLCAIESTAAEGVSWLAAAAQVGEPEALQLLGLAYFRGQGVEKDLARARRLQTEAAERGVIDAQFELSLLLAQGLGGKLDARGARHWEGKAAQAGHPRACLNRAVRAARTRPPDFAEAVRWYERAAESGSAEAAARLCRMYLAGQGVRRDEAAAKRWYERAAELGRDGSAERRG